MTMGPLQYSFRLQENILVRHPLLSGAINICQFERQGCRPLKSPLKIGQVVKASWEVLKLLSKIGFICEVMQSRIDLFLDKLLEIKSA